MELDDRDSVLIWATFSLAVPQVRSWGSLTRLFFPILERPLSIIENGLWLVVDEFRIHYRESKKSARCCNYNCCVAYSLLLSDLLSIYSWKKLEKKIGMMLSRSMLDRMRSLLCTVRRPVSSGTDFDLAHRMKRLNETHQYEKVLDLFNTYKGKKDIKQLSSMIITQALKACSRTGNLQYGSSIHHLVSSRLNTDPYIASSLIHLYSKLIQTVLSLL